MILQKKPKRLWLNGHDAAAVAGNWRSEEGSGGGRQQSDMSAGYSFLNDKLGLPVDAVAFMQQVSALISRKENQPVCVASFEGGNQSCSKSECHRSIKIKDHGKSGEDLRPDVLRDQKSSTIESKNQTAEAESSKAANDHHHERQPTIIKPAMEEITTATQASLPEQSNMGFLLTASCDCL